MNPFQKSISYIGGMSLVKKVLIVFLCLLFFVLVVEQPGSPDSKRLKGEKLLFPTLLASQAVKVEFSNLPDPIRSLTLSKTEDQWQVINGHSYPADRQRVDRFLSILENMVSEQKVSDNPARVSVFGLDETVSPHVQVWDSRPRLVADLLVGKTDPEGLQYVRKAGSNEVDLVSQPLAPFLLQDLDGWKDKTLLSVSEKDAQRVVLSKGADETVLEKKGETWRMTSPEDLEPDPLALRTLFDQITDFRADRLADSLEGTQVDFEKPDYTISVRLADGSLRVVVFSATKDHASYYAKNGDKSLIYMVSPSQVENLFGLKLKSDKPAK
jgi:hypothetical protein